MTTSRQSPRRAPDGSSGPTDLRVAADDLLAEAKGLRAGRSARTLTPGAGAPLKQTLLALTSGSRLQEHVAPGPTTLLGVRGTCILRDGDGAVTVLDGVWTPVPTGPHELEAVTDTVVLLTVATSSDREGGSPDG
ncbi:MAG: hypothetical protein WD011_03780 [Nitriliruptoraceae bacterium]